jgi:hypothetical protein
MYNLAIGEQAFVDTFDGAAELGRKVRTVIRKLAVGFKLDGKVKKSAFFLMLCWTLEQGLVRLNLMINP